MVDPGTHVAVTTYPKASLPAALPSVVDPSVDSAPVSSNHALSSDTATSFVANIAGGSSNTDNRPSTRAASAVKTTDSVSDLRLFVFPSVLTDHPVPSFATPGRVASKKKSGLKRYGAPYTK